MVSVMMATIKITDRGSGVLLRPMNSSSDCLLAYISSTEISKGIIIGEKNLAENLFCYLLSRLFSLRIPVAFWLFGKECSGDFFLLSLVIHKTVANSLARACVSAHLSFGNTTAKVAVPLFACQCMSIPHHHSFE